MSPWFKWIVLKHILNPFLPVSSPVTIELAILWPSLVIFCQPQPASLSVFPSFRQDCQVAGWVKYLHGDGFSERGHAWHYLPGPGLTTRCLNRRFIEVRLVRQEGIQWLRWHYFALFSPKGTSTMTFLTLNVDRNSDFLTTSSCPRPPVSVGLKSILRLVYF